MYHFGTKSTSQLLTLHPDLQLVLRFAIRIYDFSVICGHRGRVQQNQEFDDGDSQVRFPNSYHNTLPSNAVDIAPYMNGGIPWDNEEEFFFLAGLILAVAELFHIEIEWGGRWGMRDLGHFQLKRKES